MIIIRAPFRLPIGGGGTDLPAYYKQFGGQLITASINRYMFVNINEPATSDKIKLYYKFSEQVNDVSEIKHDIIRESLKLHNINRPIEIGSMADIEAGTGMGSSSVFTVALLVGLNTLERKFISPKDLAEEACMVEINLVGKPIGKQDQYASCFGGINELIIDKTGTVTVNPLKPDREVIFELENRLLMFYTNVTRDANEILSEQSEKVVDQLEVIEAMHEIKEIGWDIKKALLSGDIDKFGKCLHDHWIVKKTISDKMSSTEIDHWYQLALQNGALGGKIMGAGGGGLLLFCVKQGGRKQLKDTMQRFGLKYMDFRFEFEGVKVLANY
jgi:D-glycero-alpha-D-manno-heptose-7-phosphate kinase